MTDLLSRHGVLCHGSVLPVFCWVAVLLFSVTAIAVPSNEKPWTFHQPDGTPFQAILKGSEYYAYHETPEGEKIVRDDATGYWHYALPRADGRLERTAQIVGQSGPKMAPSNKELTQWSDAVERIIDQRAKEMTEHFLENEKVPPTGALRGVLLLANFSDTSTTFAQSDFNNLMNTPGYNQNSALGSVRDYYYEASYGALTIQIDVYGWVDLPETRYYYGHNVVGNDQNPRQMVIDAISAADSVVDFSYYDSDGDGWVDFFGVVHQGQGEEQSGAPEDCIWSHRAGLFSAMNVDGVQIQDYYTAPELYYARLSTIGVFCHEMGHVFNLPDLYATTGSSQGVGNWSLMGTGAWCGPGSDGSKPCHFDPWCKMALGWLRPTTVFGPRTGIPLLNLDQNAQALRIPIDPYQDGEYFLVCNRYQRAAGAGAGFDQYLPGSGALILHIDDYVYSNDTPARKKVDVEEADGLSQLDSGANRGNAGDLYPNGAASFTDSTFPNTKDNDGNSTGIIVNGFTGGGTAAMTTSVTPLASLNGKYIGYDETGASTTGHGWDGNDYGCVRFTTLSGGTLRRVKTYFAYTGTTDYTVSVFSGWSGSAPTGLLTSQSGSHTGRGYEEIVLASPQTFAPNSEFCVQVQYDSHFMFLFVLPLALDWNCSGNSWVSADGVNYVHLAQDSTLPYDLNIRADLDSPTGTIKQDGTADFTNFTDAIYWANAMPGANTLLVLDTATYTESPPAITETVAIQGNGAALTGGFVLNTAGVAISNLTINGPAANHIDVAVGGASVTLTDCMLEGSSSNNLRVSSGASAALSGCTIRNASGHGISNEGGTLDLTNCTVYGNGGSGIHVTASAALNVTSSALRDNGAYGVDWTASATSNTNNTFADCTFQQQALRLFHIEDGCYVKRVELTNPVFSGKCGQDLAFYIGTGGVGSSAAGDGFRIVGTGTGSTRIDFDPMLEGGTQAVARVRKGDLVFVKGTGTKISADNAYWIDSRGATALGGEVKVVFDRCYWKNGAGSYWAGTEGGGSSGVIIEAVNTMWVWDTAADHNHGAVLNLGGNHTGASEIRLRHCTLKALNNIVGYNLSGSLVRGNENFSGSPVSRGDVLYGGWTIFDASGVTGAVDSTAGSNLSLTRYAGYPSAPCVAWRTIGFTGFGSVPGETINVSPNLASSGYLQDGVSYAAMNHATNSTEASDIDGNVRPLPGGTTSDIGAHESSYNDITAPSPGIAVPPVYANTSPFAVGYNGAQDDASGSGLGGVELWCKFGPGGTWTSTGLIQTGGSGVFNFVPANGEGTYYFALAAWDNFGNNSATPGGNGDGSTLYDITPPAVTAITPTTPSPTNGSTVAFAVNFSEVVAGFADASDLAIAETGTLSHTGITFAGGPQNYAVTVTGVTGNGTMTLTINTGSGVRDLATNDLASSPTSAPVTVDQTFPAVSMTCLAPDPTNMTPIPVTVTFTRDVVGFDLSDVAVSNAAKGNFQAIDPAHYGFDLTPLGQGLVSADIPSGVAQDAGGNANTAAVPLSRLFDSIAPAATLTLTTPSPTTEDTVNFDVVFSEPLVSDLAFDDVTLTGTLGVVSGKTVTGTGTAYTVAVTPADADADGTVGIAVQAGLLDAAGNQYAGGASALCTVYNWFGFGMNIANARLYVGDTHAMSVSVVCGSGPLSYQWKWNDNLGKAVHLLGTQPTETIASATTAQRGEYWCEVTYSGLAQLSNLAEISVEPHLLITQQPSGGDRNGGGTHVFRVQTTGGYQPLTYVWLKDGIVLPGQTSDSITLGPLQESDSGTYTVEIADNGLDSIESEPAELTVLQGVPVVGVVGCALLTLFCVLGGATVLWRSCKGGFQPHL